MPASIKKPIDSISAPINPSQKINSQIKRSSISRGRVPINPATLIEIGLLSEKDTEQ